MTRHPGKHRQSGAVAIEMAPAFLLFFAIFYAIVSYSMAMVMKQALTQAAAEGARAAVKVDPLNYTSATSYENATRAVARARATESLSWLPADALATASMSLFEPADSENATPAAAAARASMRSASGT